MQQKTNVHAAEGSQDLVITRTFDLPVQSLFRAYTEADLLAQWMSTNVLMLESWQYGRYRFETSDPRGNVVFQAHGVIHEYVPNQQITRTFEMMNGDFAPQLEFLRFEPLGDRQSQLTMHIVYRSVAHRDHMLRLPFAQGISSAHDHLQALATHLL